MVLHLIGFPHTSTTKDYGQCAYTQKNYKFIKMFANDPNRQVIHYGNEGSIGNLVQIFSKKELQEYYGSLGDKYYTVNWGGDFWLTFNKRVINELKTRIRPEDFILILGGVSQKEIADSYPSNICVEYGVGYEGIFSNYRVFESYAWMHYMYGKTGVADGKFYDCVIPNFFDPDEFHLSDKEDYMVFFSRMTPRKGYKIAIEIAERTKTKLIIAGAGGDRPQSDYVEYVGYADAYKRAELMSKAKALLCPTQYIEPFGGVTVEAMLSGTPVITTDFGAFGELVLHGLNGYRCHTLEQFVWAAKNVDKLDCKSIREYAVNNYSLERIKKKYDEYFDSLDRLFHDGWYSENNSRDNLDWLKKVA